MGEEKPPRSRDLIDQSKLLNKRARKQVRRSVERIARVRHDWQTIALGRICNRCQLTQAPDEFDDSIACKAG